MPTRHLAPGVFIEETGSQPERVGQVATSVAAFLGYTAKAVGHDEDGDVELTNVPVRINSLLDYERHFGGPPDTLLDVGLSRTGTLSCAVVASTWFLLHDSLSLFFNNGGDTCWIVSLGNYGSAKTPATKRVADFDRALARLAEEAEPALIVAPDAVLLSRQDWARVAKLSLQHCARLKNRVTILDVHDGDRPRTLDGDDVVSGTLGFRSLIGDEGLSFGAAYYPWLKTTVVQPTRCNFTQLTPESKDALSDTLQTELSVRFNAQTVANLMSDFLSNEPLLETVDTIHQSFMTESATYVRAMEHMSKSLSVLPPAAAVAGAIARSDKKRGVFKAPANIALASVASPSVTVSDSDQQDLNAPQDGKAINAIRFFAGNGTLIWGARTLQANNGEWRYINVRRTAIMLDQSIKHRLTGVALEQNNSGTWATVKILVSNFMHEQWRSGALAGSTTDDAFMVRVGLGESMTQADIDTGWLIVTVHFAMMRPAEFIGITVRQKMQ